MANPAAMAMRPISRQRISEARSAFTLIELLVAMAILAVLVAAVSRGLITSMNADETSALVFDGSLVMNRCEAGIVRNEDAATMNILAGPEWQFIDEHRKADESNAVPWRVVSLRSAVRPSLQIQSAMRAD